MAWLHWMQGDLGEGTVGACPKTDFPVGGYVGTMVGVYGRFVEIERDLDAYVLRVLPRNPDQESGGMALGLAYRGVCLPELCRYAVWDLDRLSGGMTDYRAGRTELQRWVP